MAKVILGLGTNVGDRFGHLEQSCRYICRSVLTSCQFSSIYESPALLLPGAPEEWNSPFLNMVVSGETDATPTQLLSEVKAIERHIDRKVRGKWAPREIDVDILAYDNIEMTDEHLTIPHAAIKQRDFVLLPLKDIAPQWRHPSQGWSVAEACAELDSITAIRCDALSRSIGAVLEDVA